MAPVPQTITTGPGLYDLQVLYTEGPAAGLPPLAPATAARDGSVHRGIRAPAAREGSGHGGRHQRVRSREGSGHGRVLSREPSGHGRDLSGHASTVLGPEGSVHSVINVCVAEDDIRSEIVSIKGAELPPTAKSELLTYFSKWQGGLDTAPGIPSWFGLFISWLGAFVAILVICLVDQAMSSPLNFPLLVGSFGASAVLVYGVPESKLAQPRNLLGGQVLSAVVGALVRLALGTTYPYLTAALGMSLALLVMQLTGTTHPPGGATALIACTAPHLTPWHGFQIVVAVALGSCIMAVIGLLLNNVVKARSYPTYWLGAHWARAK